MGPGQVNSRAIGTDVFQEADIVGSTMPFVKHSFMVTRPEDVMARVAEIRNVIIIKDYRNICCRLYFKENTRIKPRR